MRLRVEVAAAAEVVEEVAEVVALERDGHRVDREVAPGEVARGSWRARPWAARRVRRRTPCAGGRHVDAQPPSPSETTTAVPNFSCGRARGRSSARGELASRRRSRRPRPRGRRRTPARRGAGRGRRRRRGRRRVRRPRPPRPRRNSRGRAARAPASWPPIGRRRLGGLRAARPAASARSRSTARDDPDDGSSPRSRRRTPAAPDLGERAAGARSSGVSCRRAGRRVVIIGLDRRVAEAVADRAVEVGPARREPTSRPPSATQDAADCRRAGRRGRPCRRSSSRSTGEPARTSRRARRGGARRAAGTAAATAAREPRPELSLTIADAAAVVPAAADRRGDLGDVERRRCGCAR